jgi:hypothetical protein
MRILLSTLLILALPAMALAGPSIVGSINGWDPADAGSELSPLGSGYTLTLALLAGHHEYKCTETDAWDGNDFPGANQMFDLAADDNVQWFVNLGATVGVKEGDEYVAHQAPTIAGDLIAFWGGAAWDPADPAGQMAHLGGGIFELGGMLPAGHHECKVTMNGNWDQDTGPNFAFDLPMETYVNFVYDFGTNTLTEGDAIATQDATVSQIKASY